MFFKKITLIFFAIILSTQIIYSLEIKIESEENLVATQINPNQIKINLNGNLNITNPTLKDSIYQFEFQFRNDLNFNFHSTDNTIIFTNRELKGNQINPNSSKLIPYSFETIIPKTYYDQFTTSGKSFIEWSSKEIIFKPIRNINLDKAQRENQTTTNNSPRWISINGLNPTTFHIEIEAINLYKTNSQTNKNFLDNQYLVNSFQNFNLNPQEKFFVYHRELNSSDEDIYWIDSKISTKYQFTKNLTINFNTQKQPSKSGGSKQITFPQTITQNLTFTKQSDKDKIKLNETLTLSLHIQNPNDFKISNILIEDKKSKYFDYKNQDLKFKIDEMLEHETKIIQYTSKYTKKTPEQIIFIPPAKLTFDGNIIYSNILNLLQKPQDYKEQLLILEKSIKHLDDKNSIIHIKIKNIGNKIIENIRIIENTNSNNQKEIKSWTIPTLYQNQTWETSYKTKTQNANYFVPNIFVNESVKIFKTINTNEIVDSSIYYIESSTFTTVLIISTVLLFFTDLLF